MKHIFVFNPSAGNGKNSPDEIRQKLQGLDIVYEIYITKDGNDISRFVRERLSNNPSGEKLRFYACGGDGTIKGVADGLIGYKNAELSVYPIGSGNDFVKYYGGKDGFLSLAELIKCEAHPIDVIKVGNEYSVNVTNFGFDAAVCDTMIKVKNKKLIGGKNAYTTGIIKSIFTATHNHGDIYADGKLLNQKSRYMLCTIGNAYYVGGAYMCSPRATTNDGLLEVCTFKTITIFRFLSMIKDYMKGTYLDKPEFKKHFTYTRAKKVYVKSDKPFSLCLDGDIRTVKEFTAEVVSRAIMFVSPVYPEKNRLLDDAEAVKQI